ncbi:MAG: bi-domain-containing oxidoreductase [Sphingomonadales bacterium]|nr:bi-domain-containing oxidoreductase [Sphingomonadales bacterium]
MKQLLQSLKDGSSEIVEVPSPGVRHGNLLIQASCTLISAGTERMLVDFGRAGYLEKARQQPEKVKMVLDKIKTDGLMPTIDAVKSKLDQPLPMGYSNVGIVLEVGKGVTEFQVGDRVVSNGSHAEVVCVPKNLCAVIPGSVADDDAVFTVVGAIALQGIRLAQPTLGECFVVTGLGLIGLMAVQILRAQGCRVLGIDLDPEKLKLAKEFGAEVVNLGAGEDPISAAERFSRGHGVDGVIITAASKSNEPMRQAASMCRKRGRIVLVGVVGLELQRADFYEKELTFQVSCSYGPGRYDPTYEQEGHDYPIGFVRWTEKRNFEAVLDMMAAGSLRLEPLRTHRFAFEDAAKAYDLLVNDRSALGIILDYGTVQKTDSAVELRTLKLRNAANVISRIAKPVIGALGAGNYAGRILLPAFAKTGSRLKTIASAQGVSGTYHGGKLGFEYSTTDTDSIFSDTEIDTVIIGTQHNSHARYVVQALNAGKNVFVEKPLALRQDELSQIDAAYRAAYECGSTPRLMVGYNRRFAPLIQKMKAHLGKSPAPMSIVYTCNAGAIPSDSWVQNPELGGGRIIGEACHFIDLSRFLAASSIVDVTSAAMSQPKGIHDNHDIASVTLRFANGSLATIHYFANGHRSFPKERIEVFQEGRIYVVDNFRQLKGYGEKGVGVRTFRQDKGQQACCEKFIKGIVAGADSPIPYEELMEVSAICIKAAEMIEQQR